MSQATSKLCRICSRTKNSWRTQATQNQKMSLRMKSSVTKAARSSTCSETIRLKMKRKDRCRAKFRNRTWLGCTCSKAKVLITIATQNLQMTVNHLQDIKSSIRIRASLIATIIWTARNSLTRARSFSQQRSRLQPSTWPLDKKHPKPSFSTAKKATRLLLVSTRHSL